MAQDQAFHEKNPPRRRRFDGRRHQRFRPVRPRRLKGDAFASNGVRISESHSSTNGYIGGGIGYKLNKEVTLTAAVDYTQGKLSGDKVKATLYSLGASDSF